MQTQRIIEERRTLLVANDTDDEVRIWSAQERYITELRHNASFTEINSGHIGDSDTEWVEFSIPAANWNPATGATSTSTSTPTPA